jgi:hypothetical protein
MAGPRGVDNGAAERARRIAEQQRREAERAQQKAREQEARARRAQQQAQRAEKQLNRTEDRAGNKVNATERAEVRDARRELTRANESAEGNRERARTAKDDAIREGDEAITAMKDANRAARAEGGENPYAQAERVRNTYDAGSLSGADQKRLFGTRSAVSPQEAAQEDSRAVTEAANRGPAAGAKELERQLKANDDPAYRAELMNSSRATVDRIGYDLNRPGVSEEETTAAVDALASAADYAGSPQARYQISQALTGGTPLSGTSPGESPVQRITPEGQRRIDAALGAVVERPAGARLALDVSDRRNEAGDYAGADRIEKMSPRLKHNAQQTDGETAARQSVQVRTAEDARSQAEQKERDLRTDATRRTDRTFELANDPDNLPPNVEVTQKSENRVQLVERNEQGEVVARTTAVREGEQVRYEQLEYGRNGEASRHRVEAGPDGVYAQKAAWREGPSRNPETPPTVQELQNSRSRHVALQEERTYRNTDGNLEQTSLRKGENGIESTRRTFSQQNGTDGIDDNFDSKFDEGQPIDKVQTHTVTIPPPGAKGPDGEPAQPVVTDSTAYSQDGVQATSLNARPLENGNALSDPSRQPVVSDVEAVEDAAADLEDDKIPPKQWNLEVSNGNTYRSQTFVEGQEDLSTVTTRTARGSSVHETITGKAPNEEGEPTEVSAESTRTFRDDGSLRSMQSTSTDPSGVVTTQEYENDRRRTARGVQSTDRLTVTQEQDGERTVSNRETTSLLTREGPQLLRTQQTLTQPDGSSARTTVDGEGERFEVGGPGEPRRAVPESEISRLNANTRDLLAQTNASVYQDVKEFAGYGQKGVTALKLPAASTTIRAINEDPQSRLAARFGEVPATNAVRAVNGAAGAAGAVAGAAGLVTSTQAIIQGVRSGNLLVAARGVVDFAASGRGVVDGTRGLLGAIQGGSQAGAAGASGWFARAGGVGTVLGLASGGLTIAEGIASGRESLIAQGAVTVAGTVGAVVVGAAVTGALAGSVVPVVGTAIGAAAGAIVGLGAAAINKFVVAPLFDDEHAIAEVRI